MKYLMMLTVGLCLLTGTVTAVADQAADEAAIREAAKELNATWNPKDLDAHFALIDENFVMNDRKMGKAAHREYLEKLFSSDDYSEYKHDEIDLVFVTPDVAIYRIDALRVKSNENVDLAWVFSKKSGKWLLAASFW